MKMTYTGTVKRLWERLESHYVSGVGGEAVFERVSMGHYIVVADHAYWVGMLPPKCAPGDIVEITIKTSKPPESPQP